MSEPHDEHTSEGETVPTPGAEPPAPDTSGPTAPPPWQGPPPPGGEPTREFEGPSWPVPPPAAPAPGGAQPGAGAWAPPPWAYPPASGWGYGPSDAGGAHAPGGPGGPGGHQPGQWGWSPYPYPPPRPHTRHTGLWVALLVAVLALASVTGVGLANREQLQQCRDHAELDHPDRVHRQRQRALDLRARRWRPSPTRSRPGLVDVNTVLGYAHDEAAGTGIVLTSNGEILTNNHVIEGATQIRVTSLGNNKTYTASVVGYDRTNDVAIIQAKNASGLPTAPLGDSSKVAVGQTVVGVGNAGGTGGTPSAAGGKVTALDQRVTASDQADGTSENLTGLIQTNANIQAGDSGGPLADTAGKVIGIDTAGSAGYTIRSNAHQGFAIPINKALDIGKQITAMKASSSVHIGPTAFLGIEVQSSATPGSGNSGSGNSGVGNSGNSGVGNSGNSGAGNSGNSGNTGSTTVPSGGNGSATGTPVGGVIAGTPAATIGLAQGDTITSLGGHQVTSPTALSSILDGYHPGDNVAVTWTDAGGQSHTANVTLANGPAA